MPSAPPNKVPITSEPLPDEICVTAPFATADDSLNVIAAYLTQYRPPARTFPADGAWTAEYDVISWEGSLGQDLATFFRLNRVIGRLAVTRRPEAGGASLGYDFDQVIRLNNFESAIRSTMRCAAESLPRLLEWETHYEKRRVNLPGSSRGLGERGRHENGVLEIASGAGIRRLRTDRPVATTWAVWDALRGAGGPCNPFAGLEFDLLHDLTSYRPRQRLAPCGPIECELAGKPCALHGFLQTGAGTEPTHYWIDSSGRPLLITGGLLSLALTSIRAAESPS